MDQQAFEQLLRRSFRRCVRRLAQQVLAFSEDHLLDQIQVPRVFGQEDEVDASDANELARGFATAMIVDDDVPGPSLVDVSSIKTERSGLDAILILAPLHPGFAIGATRSPAAPISFEVELLALDEVSDRPMIDLEAALGEFGDKPTQGEFPYPGALQQAGAVFARNCRRLVPAYLPKRNAAVSRKRRIQGHHAQMPKRNCAAAW